MERCEICGQCKRCGEGCSCIAENYLKTGQLNIPIIQYKREDTKKMATLRETATAYKPKQTLNIADLNRVELDSFQIEDREGTDSEGKTFEYKVMVANDLEYRIPNTVIEEIKKILDLKPEVKAVTVSKSGSGLATRYSVKVVD